MAVIKGQIKMFQKKNEQIRAENDNEQEDGGDDIDDMFQTMWTGILYYTKYKSNLGYKAVYYCTIPYLTAMMMTGFEFSEDLEKDQINPWPKQNPMVLDKMIINM